MFLKNTASQKFIVFAWDTTTGLAKTGDAANITAYVSKDYGTVTVLGDTSATEMDATNAKGYYLFDATQGETNAEVLMVSAKSSTANISVIGAPAIILTLPTTGVLSPATLGRTLVIDASGLADANAVKIGPSGSGTAQTARDVGASVLLSTGTGTGQLDFTSGVVKANLAQILGTALTETAGQIAAGFKQFFNIGSPTSTMNTITAVTTATNLTNAPTSGDFTATMKTSIGTAVAASAVASVTGNVGGSVASVVGLTASNLDAAISSRLATSGYTAPDNTSITAIKAKTDSLTFTVAGQVDANAESMNATTILGNGSSGNLWRG